MTEDVAPAIFIQHLYAGYGQETILEDVNLEVYADDFIGVIGPNGGGKSTLLKVILGLLPQQSGEVRVMGMDVRQGRTHIGYVPQFVEADRAFPISVWDTVGMGLLTGWKLFRRFSTQDNAKIEDALSVVGMLHLREKVMGELSGGQRKRVFIARALVSDPRILLLDEPTASVDPNATSEVYELLSRLNQRMAILLVSHDMMAISYDETFSTVRGVPVDAISLILTALIALTVVMMMRVVGLILVIALLTLPAAIATLFARSMRQMMALSSLFGAVFTLIGLWLSYQHNLTSGATIILVAAAAYLLALVAKKALAKAPGR